MRTRCCAASSALRRAKESLLCSMMKCAENNQISRGSGARLGAFILVAIISRQERSDEESDYNLGEGRLVFCITVKLFDLASAKGHYF
jgi:hypothetical protein